MSANDETAVTAVFGTLKKNWGWLLALGIVSIALGTIGLYMTFALTLATVLLFGALILAGGALQLIHAFSCKGWRGVLGHVLIALLYIAAGILIIMDSRTRVRRADAGAGRHPDGGRGDPHQHGHTASEGRNRVVLVGALRHRVHSARRHDRFSMAGVGPVGHRPVRGRRAHP